MFSARHIRLILSVDLQVVEGLDIVKKIEQSSTDRQDRPKSAVVISDAGEL